MPRQLLYRQCTHLILLYPFNTRGGKYLLLTAPLSIYSSTLSIIFIATVKPILNACRRSVFTALRKSKNILWNSSLSSLSASGSMYVFSNLNLLSFTSVDQKRFSLTSPTLIMLNTLSSMLPQVVSFVSSITFSLFFY